MSFFGWTIMYIINNKNGFTLIEALVSMVILSLGIIPSLVVILSASNFSSSLKNNLIAANLAQEGLEVVRAIRDTNWFNSRAFDNGLTSPTFDCSTGCIAEWNSNSLSSLSGNPQLKIDSSGVYNYSTGTDTGFRRKIIITKDPSSPGCNCELKIVSEISWSERGKNTVVSVESHLYNWR